MEILRLIVSGLANGCIYGLIALGFVLIYKATEQVNFAQGDMMMLGAFIALAIGNDSHLGAPFWVACTGAIFVMAAVGWLLEWAVLRRVFGQPQTAVMIFTIAVGFVLRFAAGAIRGHDPLALENPVAGANFELGGLIVGLVEPFASRYIAAGYSQIAPCAIMILVLVLRPHGIFAQVRAKKV